MFSVRKAKLLGSLAKRRLPTLWVTLTSWVMQVSDAGRRCTCAVRMPPGRRGNRPSHHTRQAGPANTNAELPATDPGTPCPGLRSDSRTAVAPGHGRRRSHRGRSIPLDSAACLAAACLASTCPAATCPAACAVCRYCSTPLGQSNRSVLVRLQGSAGLCRTESTLSTCSATTGQGTRITHRRRPSRWLRNACSTLPLSVGALWLLRDIWIIAKRTPLRNYPECAQTCR